MQIIDNEKKSIQAGGTREEFEAKAERGVFDEFVFLDDKCASWTTVTNTLISHTFSTKNKFGRNYAICSHPLSREKVSKWKVTVLNVSDSGGLFVGVIGKNKIIDIDGARSFWDCTSCVWGSYGQASDVWINGERNVEGEGDSWLRKEDSGNRRTAGGSVWRKGDEAVFSYSPFTGLLEMTRFNTIHVINTSNFTSSSSSSSSFHSPPVYLQFWFAKVGTELKVEMLL